MTVRGKCVALLSGGVDSAVACAIARKQGLEVYALTVDYGQRNRFEIEAAKKLAKFLGAREH
ncbi:MAG TPA: 7-cyano-7-deazaguanine synthase, partial [Proteobacteria bacterium]|nr:7-cyano-7-deazaguanine synthase [Pseudomonadota bacterium]